jgi:hypothetical protein
MDKEAIKKLNESKGLENVLEAFDKSIRHWQNIAEGRDATKSCTNCALCIFTNGLCQDGCPVGILDEMSNCHCIGYFRFVTHVRIHHLEPLRLSKAPEDGHYRIYCPECIKLANDVVKGLQTRRDIWVKESAIEKPKYFLKIANPETAIGEGNILIQIVDKTGERVNTGGLATLDKNGRLYRFTSCGGTDTPLSKLLQRDSQGRVLISDKGV